MKKRCCHKFEKKGKNKCKGCPIITLDTLFKDELKRQKKKAKKKKKKGKKGKKKNKKKET